VFGVLPTFDKTLEKVGVGSGGASTTWLAAAQNLSQPLDPRVAQMVQTRIDHYYRQFIGAAAAARGTTAEKIDAVAQGRVWTGRQAKSHGLIDTLGGLQEAVASAARRAKLDDYAVAYVEREPRGLERWLSMLLGQMARAAATHLGGSVPSALAGVGPEVQDEVQRLGRLFSAAREDPTRAYAYCFCRLR
jgi:protease-4